MSALLSKGKKQASGLRKVVGRDPACSWPCEQLKLSQWRCRDHGVDDSELQ
jgi:hypothetical protein